MSDNSNIASTDSEELDLLARIADEDTHALAQLYERYRNKLGAFLRSKLFEEKLADEVYNDVMFIVWNKASEFKGGSRVSTWIFGIAYRTCMAHGRKEQKHNKNVSQVDLDALAQPIQSKEIDQAQSVRDALVELSPDHREAIVLAYFLGHSIDEIAHITDTPSNTVKTRLFHARQNLKKVLTVELDDTPLTTSGANDKKIRVH